MIDRTFVLRNADTVRALWAFVQQNWQAAADARPLSVEVREHKAKRSTQANRLYWQRLQQIASDAWVDAKQFSPEAWHAFFAGEFIGYEDGPRGHRVPISTTTLDTGSFSEYIDRVMAYAATELGVELE